MEIGERIHHYRKLCGLTQEEVAKRLETTPQNIYKYEKGIIKNIPLSSIVLMSELFGISPAELAGMSESASNSLSEPVSEKEAFGIRLRLKRESLGLSARELALKLHIIPSIIENFEKGTFDELPDSMLLKLAEFFNTTPDYFKSSALPENPDKLNLSETERLVIIKYRANPQYHNAIHQLLAISPDDVEENKGSLRYKTLTSSDFDNGRTRGRIAEPEKFTYNANKKD